jgi:hypothetical protein
MELLVKQGAIVAEGLTYAYGDLVAVEVTVLAARCC